VVSHIESTRPPASYRLNRSRGFQSLAMYLQPTLPQEQEQKEESSESALEEVTLPRTSVELLPGEVPIDIELEPSGCPVPRPAARGFIAAQRAKYEGDLHAVDAYLGSVKPNIRASLAPFEQKLQDSQEPMMQDIAQLSERWGLEYCAQVVQSPEGPRLDIDVDVCDDGRLHVRKVMPGGLLAMWNKSNPNQSISEGDYVISINGQSEQLATAIQAEGRLDMRLQVAPSKD